jgi:hypothetical protein
MVYQLDFRKGIYQLGGQRKKYERYQLFKYKNISKFTIYQTIKDCENGLPCVVKPKKNAKCVAKHQTPRDSVVMAL